MAYLLQSLWHSPPSQLQSFLEQVEFRRIIVHNPSGVCAPPFQLTARPAPLGPGLLRQRAGLGAIRGVSETAAGLGGLVGWGACTVPSQCLDERAELIRQWQCAVWLRSQADRLWWPAFVTPRTIWQEPLERMLRPETASSLRAGREITGTSRLSSRDGDLLQQCRPLQRIPARLGGGYCRRSQVDGGPGPQHGQSDPNASWLCLAAILRCPQDPPLQIGISPLTPSRPSSVTPCDYTAAPSQATARWTYAYSEREGQETRGVSAAPIRPPGAAPYTHTHDGTSSPVRPEAKAVVAAAVIR